MNSIDKTTKQEDAKRISGLIEQIKASPDTTKPKQQRVRDLAVQFKNKYGEPFNISKVEY